MPQFLVTNLAGTFRTSDRYYVSALNGRHLEYHAASICDGDEPFLSRLYASTRQDEMALTGWSQPQIDEFLEMQFTAQHRFYLHELPPSEFNIIVGDGVPIGRLYVGDWDEDVRLIDIALLPEHRNQGIGTRLIRNVMDRATRGDKPVRLHVEQNNPARRLYTRLGFIELEDRGMNVFMEWQGSSL